MSLLATANICKAVFCVFLKGEHSCRSNRFFLLIIHATGIFDFLIEQGTVGHFLSVLYYCLWPLLRINLDLKRKYSILF